MRLGGALLILVLGWSAFGFERTDLGPTGNQAVVQRYQTYLASGPRCSAATAVGTKILLTGFGLFSGIDSNISSAVVKGAAALLPATLPDSTAPATADVLPAGVVSSSVGVDSVQRVFTIGDRSVTVCFLSLDVQWDFAAAVVVTEVQNFSPDNVFMFGQGDTRVIVESGVQNRDVSYSGFNSDGSFDEANSPVSPTLFDSLPASLRLSVDQARVGAAIAPAVAALGVSLFLPSDFRPSNDYICNNIGYSVQAAADGYLVPFAGGLLPLQLTVAKPPVVSFIHLPVENALDLPARPWLQLVLNLIDSTAP